MIMVLIVPLFNDLPFIKPKRFNPSGSLPKQKRNITKEKQGYQRYSEYLYDRHNTQ